MKLHEITLPVNEVNVGAIPGALADIARQAIMRNPESDRVGPVATPGQEQNMAYALTNDLVKKQGQSANQVWQQAIQAKLEEFGVSDAGQLPRKEIEKTLTDYINRSLLAGQSVANIQGQPVLLNSIQQTMQTIVLNTMNNQWKDPKTADAWMRLVKGLRIAQAQDVKQMQSAVGNTGADPETQQLQKRFATQIAAMKSSTQRHNQSIRPTPNRLINAIAGALGLMQ
jgi:hypothetical protein